MSNYYKPGTWNVLCFVCGKQYKSDEILKRWDGVLVCRKDWEPRHPQEFIRTPKESSGVPYVSNESADQFIGTTCPYPTQYAMADIGTADCSLADRVTTVFVPTITAGSAIAGTAVTNISYASQRPIL